MGEGGLVRDDFRKISKGEWAHYMGPHGSLWELGLLLTMGWEALGNFELRMT